MRLYGGQVPVIAEDILRVLKKEDALEIEPENVDEVKLDIESVLREYIRMDREVTTLARDQAAQTGQSLGRAKRSVARDKGFEVGDDAIAYIINQLIETFLHSQFVEEVYAEDNDFRRHIKPILARASDQDEKLDREVRDKIKNIEEGSAAWDVEYQKAMGKLKRNKNLE